jgi:hypothetical protein
MRWTDWGLWAVVGVYLALAVTYGLVAPPFESPDEVGHFFTVKYIADRGRLPDPDREPAERYLYGQEGTQPPLYYLTGGLLLRISGIDTQDGWDYLRVNPHTTCGSPHLTGNKAFLAHDPVREAFPWRGSILALHLLRLYSTALGLVTVLGVYAVARLCFPTPPWGALLATGLTAFNPQFLFVSAGINNDNLLVPLCVWAVYLTLWGVKHGFRPRISLFIGALAGLAALTKLGGVLLLPLAGLAVVLQRWMRRADRRPIAEVVGIVGHGVLMGLPALIVGGWWYLRNALLHGDPTLIEHHLDIVSRRDPTPLGHILHEVPSIFYSYWGRFTCDLSPGAWYYAFWGGIVVLGLLGLAWRWRRLTAHQRVSVLLLGVWFVLVFSGWFRWNLLASGVQGRLLFPATVSVSVLVGAGWTHWAGRRRWVGGLLAAGGLALALWALLGLIRPTFRPPPRYASASDLEIPHPVGGTFGERVTLLGYELSAESVEPGGTVEVTLYLSAQRPMTEAYSMGLWLVSAIPGDTTRLTGLDTWPGDGNYPTHVWKPGEVIVDRYRLPIPRTVDRAQAWTLQVNVYPGGSSGWFPFAVDGQELGARALLGLVRVGASSPPPVPEAAALEAPMTFGDAIALRGERTARAEDHLAVTLWWEARQRVETDYKVFVHLIDADGTLVANGDAPPLDGGFPTHLWRPGDRVVDAYTVPLPEDLPAGRYRLRAGWYAPDTGARLPTSDGDAYAWEVTLDGQ